MRIITTAIIKGGTGKSTTATALAQAATAEGKRVLAIDLDPQGNLSFFTGADVNRPGAYHLLHGADPAQVMQKTAQGFSVIPASADLATEKTTAASAMRLRNALEPIKKEYDLAILDTPPTIGELTFNALQAATDLIIPLEADTSSLQGLYHLADIAEQMRQSNPALTLAGVIVTRYDPRPKLNRHMLELVKKQTQELGLPFLLAIRQGIAVREAQALQRSLFEYAPKSKPALDYLNLYHLLNTER